MNPSAVNDKIVPDLEDLAAYLDDMLPDERRAVVEARLAEDPEYYEIFQDTVRFQEEEGAGEPEDVVVAPPPLVSASPSEAALLKWPVPLALAAGLLLVLLWKPWSTSLDQQFFDVTEAAALVQLDRHIRGWNTPRSGVPGVVSDAELQGVAFRLGAYQVHLELAIGARDRDAALQALGSLDRELGRLPQFLGQGTAQLKNLETTIGQGAAWDDVASDAQDFQESLSSVFSKESAQREAEGWGRWSEQVLLLYLGGHQDVLEGHLESPPPGFQDLKPVSRALQGMRDAPKSPAPSPDADKTPFLEAHEDLEDALGG